LVSANWATIQNVGIITSCKGEIAILIQRESEISAELNKLGITISDKLKLENLSVVEVHQVLAITLDESKLQKEISEFRQNLYAAKEAILELEKSIQGNDFDLANYEKLVLEVAQLEKETKQCHESLIRLEKEVSDQKVQMQRKEELQKQLDGLLMRSDNLRTMASLFRTSGFVNYISSKFLINLCNAANDKFYKLTRQQLRLEISDNNDFQIRDYLNNGKVRSIKTLSGGQTFQASLCLALALADSVQQQNKSRQNFFFLDEGFGSQDKDSLRLVFDALKALRNENRIVGIISHVEELQQEIGVYLKIKNTEEEGSVIEENVF
jgi:exonuclease SbcC